MSALRENVFKKVVDSFYEAAALPELWPETLHELSLAAGAAGAVIIPFPARAPSLTCSKGVSELVQISMQEGWIARNSKSVRGADRIASGAARIDSLQSDFDLFSDDERKRDPFYQDFLIPNGVHWGLGGSLAEADNRFIFMDILRSNLSDPFSSAEVATMNRLHQHFRTAGRLALRLGMVAEERTANLLDQMGIAAVLLDGGGRVARANGKFDDLVGNGIRLSGRRLFAERSDAQIALDRMIHASVKKDDVQNLSPIALPRRDGQLPLAVEATPLVGVANDIFQCAQAILMISDPEEQKEVDVALLRSAFSFTPAEAKLASRLASGEAPEKAATALGISVATARQQLKTIFLKTGIHRQAALVELVARLLRR